MNSEKNSHPYDSVKRVADVAAATAGLVVLSPVLAIVAVLVWRRLGRPIVFAQDRPGRHGRIFRLYKFRSMKDVDEARGLITDEQRLTSFGRALRSTSLDELPTLANVLRGEMSIVGPRPLLVAYLDRYSEVQKRRHEVRPGITGLAQVRGRNNIAWTEKFALDLEYVDHRSLRLDASILIATVLAVLRREGISAHGHATMDEFMGNENGQAGSS